MIKNLEVLINPRARLRLTALSLAGIMSLTSGCSSPQLNDDMNRETQEVVMESSNENEETFLEQVSTELENTYTLSDGKQRGILFSDEEHAYESLFEKTDRKVYMADENGNRLSRDFDELVSLRDYRYLSKGGMLLGKWTKVETDQPYNYFVGTTLRQDEDGSSLGPTVTLLNEDGLELYSFNGYFQSLIGNRLVIQDYFEGKDKVVGAPNTYLFDLETEKKTPKHHYMKIGYPENTQEDKDSYIIGVTLYYDGIIPKYSFYDQNLEVFATSTEEEIEQWYKANDDWDSFSQAGGNYDAYLQYVYQNNQKKELVIKR